MRENKNNSVRNGVKEVWRKVMVPSLSGAVFAIGNMTSVVYAAGDTSAVTKQLDNLKTLIIAVTGAVGIIILAKNVMEFAQAYQQQDSSTMHFAFGNRALAYVSTEGEDVIRNIRQQEMLADKKARKRQRGSQKRADSRENFRKEAKKMLFSMFLMLIILGALAGAAIWHKYFR